MLATDRLLPVVDMMRKLTAPGRDWVSAYDAATVVVVSPWSLRDGGIANIISESSLGDRIPSDLHITRFFSVLVNKVLERAPITEHVEARKLRADALGQQGSDYVRASQVAPTLKESDGPEYAVEFGVGSESTQP
ncbi:MAG: hypothetical protein IT307_02820 [Chloroflexi bacterium]|nr:hypothetical protein [Chloroflexota bacterium]